MQKRWIATLVVMLSTAAPALAQTASVGGIESIEATQRAADDSARNSLRDCEERYRAARVRSDMKPSERRAALAICRIAQQAKPWPDGIARSEQ